MFFRILKHFQPTGATICHSFSRFWVYPRVLCQLNIPRKPPLEHTQEELSPHILWRNLILASFTHDLVLLNELMLIDDCWNVAKGKWKALPFGLAPSSPQQDYVILPFTQTCSKDTTKPKLLNLGEKPSWGSKLPFSRNTWPQTRKCWLSIRFKCHGLKPTEQHHRQKERLYLS